MLARSAAVFGVLVLTAVPPVSAFAFGARPYVENGLARTPPMGFNDWNAYGCSVSEALIKQTARAMLHDGMVAAGYQYLNIDDCWMRHHRDAHGNLVADPHTFPDGIAELARWLHRRGLKLGMYEDVGTKTCAGYPGSLRREQQDANLFAAWRVDYVKYDECHIPYQRWPNLSRDEVHAMLYERVAQALNKTGRTMLLSMCDGEYPDVHPWEWGERIANLWRTTPDISDSWASMAKIVTKNAQLAKYARPGSWNDPDMLEVGNGGMTVAEYQSEFSLWAEMAAPLIAGTKLVSASSQTLSIYENKAVIAIDQDPRGVQGKVVSDANGLYAFAKPLASGAVAVALFNSTGATAHFGISAQQAGLPRGSSYRLTNDWSNNERTTGGRIGATIAPHATVLYNVTPGG